MNLVPITKAAPYAAADAEVTLQLVPLLAEKMKTHNCQKVFEDIEMPLLPVLVQMGKYRHQSGTVLSREI